MTYEEWLVECAKTCRSCGFCQVLPCDGCQAGGVCDSSCRCGADETYEDELCAQSPDDLDAEGELP